jgi:hypothetical protein
MKPDQLEKILVEISPEEYYKLSQIGKLIDTDGTP